MKPEKTTGSRCLTCGNSFFAVTEKCPKCDEKTEPITYYKRIRVERLAFSGITSLIIAILVCLFKGKLNLFVPSLLGSLAIILSFYFTIKYFFGIGGGFEESFLPEDKPEYADIAFSWPKFYKDAIVMVILFIIILIILLNV
jgi:ABC-type antimicrobial peptide transport system permease subunit